MPTTFMCGCARSLPIACALLTASCAFVTLRENVERIERLATVGGTVESGAPAGTVTLVMLLTADGATPVDSFVVGTRGKYFFTVPAGAYQIAAFVDAVPDFRYDRSW
jgi:hypothetical protein